VLGIILFHNLFWTLVFAVCLVPIILRFVRWYKEVHRPTMTDQEYDNWIWYNFPEIQQESLRKFRFAQENSTVDSSLKVIRGFVFPSEKDASFYKPLLASKRGADGRVRSSVSRFFVLYMAEHELCMYIRDLNVLGVECIKKDSTHYYDQITSVKMDTYGIYLSDGEDAAKVISSDYFAVTLASGEEVGVTVVSRDRDTEQTVAELRKLLGEKRYQPQKVEIVTNQTAPQYGMDNGAMPAGYGPTTGPAGYPPAAQYGGYQPVTGPFPGAGDPPVAAYPPGVPPTYPPSAPYPPVAAYPPGVPPTYPPSAPYPPVAAYPPSAPYPPAAAYSLPANPYTNTGPFPGGTSDPVSAPFSYSAPATPDYAPPVAPTEQAGAPPPTPKSAGPQS
jgi:hypothetical protein